MRHNPAINTIDSIIERESENKIAKKLIAKHKITEKKLKPYRADLNTVFFCSSPEKGASAVKEYKRRMKIN